MVSGQKQEYKRQGRDVNNTRQESGSQAQVQSSKVGQSGSNTEVTIRRMGKRSEMSARARTRLRNCNAILYEAIISAPGIIC